MPNDKYPIHFFEIPVTNIERATAFYEKVTGDSLDRMAMGEYQFGFFPRGEHVGGAIVQGDGYVPSQTGTLVYLNGTADFDGMLERAASSGGKVVMPRTSIGEYGFIARFVDTEGNLVAIHTM